jgi:hypothetical protein
VSLQGIGRRYPVRPFTVIRRELEPRAERALAGGPDAYLDLEWDNYVQRFAVEYKTPGTPKQIDAAIFQVRRYIQPASDVAPLVVAPYLRPEILEQLVEERVSGIDLSGNYAIVVPGRWLVLRTGAKNRYPSSAPIKNVYRGRSSLVAKALMLRGEFNSPTAILQELTPFGAISLPTVSKVLKSLEQDLIIQRTERIKVVQPDRLLDNLLANYKPPEIRLQTRAKVGFESEAVERMNKNAAAFGVPYAADSPAQYTILPSSEPITRIYTQSIEKLFRGFTVDTDSRFPDVDLIETTDWSVFYGRQQRNDVFWTSALQVYLEIASGEKRERQAAMQMRPALLKFAYK